MILTPIAPSSSPGNLSSHLDQFDPLPTFPGVPTFKTIPLTYTPRLYTNHSLPSISWSKVVHTPCLLRTWVPDHDVPQLIARDLVLRFLVLGHRNGLYGRKGIDSIDFARNSDQSIGGRSGFGAVDFVNKRGRFEAVNTSVRDILHPREYGQRSRNITLSK